jgi:hypothetical protein
LLSAIAAVEAVQVVQRSRQRVPEALRGVTFFGADDVWLFQESGHPNICEACSSYHLNTYRGDELRGLFPYLEILSEDFIAAKVHPHCGGGLVRVFPVTLQDTEPVGTRWHHPLMLCHN